jgi:phage terminase Nu1 subunit (DNA packaging protein)
VLHGLRATLILGVLVRAAITPHTKETFSNERPTMNIRENSKNPTKRSEGNNGTPNEPVYLASQLASICDVDLKTIHNWCDRHESSEDPAELESFRTQGGHLRFHHSAVLRFLSRWGYPIPDELLQDRPHVLVVEPDANARKKLVSALHLVRPGEEAASDPTSPASPGNAKTGDPVLGLWSTTRYYLHLWDDPYAALISLGERTGAGAPPDLAVLSLPMPGIEARAWINTARERVGDDPPHFVLVTPDDAPASTASEPGVVAAVSRSRVNTLGEILEFQAAALLSRVNERRLHARIGKPRRRVPIAPKEPIFVASQVASIWEVDLKTVHNWVEKGDMEAFRTPGRHLRFRRRSLLSFLRRYNMAVPADLAPERPRVMLIAASPERVTELRALLSPRYDVIVQPDAVAGLAELGMLSAGAGLIDAAVVSFPAARVDDQRWLDAVLRHPDTRYTRIVTVGGDGPQKHRWQTAGVAATVDPNAIEQVGPVLDQALGLVRR